MYNRVDASSEYCENYRYIVGTMTNRIVSVQQQW